MHEQAERAMQEEKRVKEAKQCLTEVAHVKREIMDPENHRQWVNSPFSLYCAKPTKFDLWKPVPQTALRFGQLTKDFLEAVRNY